jgi:hypothetical protein
VQQETPPPLLESIRQDPAVILAMAGMPADPWQARVLRDRAARVLMLCGRQTGKSTTAAALALVAALLEAPALVLLLARAERQAGELFRKVMDLYRALGQPVAKGNDMTSELHLVNGSRVVPLPGREESIRAFSGVAVLVIDEAARVPDGLYHAVRPMLAVSRGRLVCLSSAYAKTGWFYSEWTGAGRWERVKITAGQCPRISAEFLEEEFDALGERIFAREYLCEFSDLEEAVFSQVDLDMAFGCTDVEPWR